MIELELVFTKSIKKFLIASRAIMWWTKCAYSHVARKVNRKDWGAAYYQASDGKVNYEYEDIFFKKHKIVEAYKLLIPKELEMKVREECWKEAGNDYGTMQNIGIFLIDLGMLKRNPWKKGKNCSELMYTEVLVPILGDLGYNPDLIKPHHIEEIILKHFKKDNNGFWVVNTQN